MSQVGLRSREKESYWRSHWERQSSSGESIRGYCRRRGLSEATFHYWRRQLSSLDQELTVRRTTDPQVTRPRGTGMAGLVVVKVIDDSVPSAMLEIACAGGLVVRLREDAGVEVLTRVLTACRQIPSEQLSSSAGGRSC
ncbi:IS66 family insertion sequence element accessory protein TnpA [Schlesneria sp. DSM 10557]|uniref:IS66 family insertion sequence element accessory protein TnpA n=1 Tax=Schlesneria sp. DSM 10557 TaxID=3044399 RepID=UPI0035A07146